ncbi:glycosyltransferase family 2 protein [Parasedimentitalea marina]|uniref:Glycosyltransferase family 2 protein n=1 Tax=Parasedimentitalea marina TaxID=2483033 RepID=A0A3T0N0U8_9RHOB|nr:glycosyltransferase family 2 protein [Parasedimentitalea marina]AZV77643.1 glycosyltransferase family 2 protein [Parasedimentitalea marina]
MRYLAIVTLRNEAAFLLEWLAHHRAVGFTDFLVFSNDCQDGTDIMLDHLQEMGQLTHVRNNGPYDKRGIQFTAMKTADKHPLVQQADWILTLDIDEFVNIHTGDGTLHSLLEALPMADAVTLTWRLFGNGDQVRYRDQLVTAQFTRCAPEIIHWPWRAALFKTLYRNTGAYRKTGVHRPRNPDADRLSDFRWFDCEGRELGPEFKTKKLFSTFGRANFKLAQLNHYPLGSMESYVVKADRGRVNHSDLPLGMDYWVERNFNTATDTSISRYDTATTKYLDQMTSDSRLEKCHRDAVTWRHERFRLLMQQDTFRSLFSRLMMTPPSRLINETTARTLTEFALLGRTADKDKKPK